MEQFNKKYDIKQSHWKTRKVNVDQKKVEKYIRRLERLEHRAPKAGFRVFELVTYAAIVTTAAYTIFWQDFGHEEHIYSKPRAWLNRQKEKFWSFSGSERQELIDRGKISSETETTQEKK